MVKVEVDIFLSPDDIEGELKTVIVKEPTYEKVFNSKTNNTEDKLYVPIQINGQDRIYTPNPTSQRLIIKGTGSDESKNWIGSILVLIKEKHRIGGQDREVIYVKEVIKPKK